MGLFKSIKGRETEEVRTANTNDHHYPPAPGSPRSSRRQAKKEDINTEYEPPLGPLPGQTPVGHPPPYHDWACIPDTSLLPPPPTLTHQYSKNNASWSDAHRAHAFCHQFPPYTPSVPPAAVYDAVHNGQIGLERPREFWGDLTRVDSGRGRMWKGRTAAQCGDCVLLSNLVG